MRARNVKPGFFTNELLAFAHPQHQVTYAGLWCIADRRGVLEDRPKQIHMLVNPGRPLAKTTQSIAWLADHGFIVRYEIKGIKLIKVLQFGKHQNPHRDEKASEHPDYSASTVSEQYSAQFQHSAGHGADTVPIGLIPSSLIPDSGSLIPDSGNTVPKGANDATGSLVKSRELFERAKAAYPPFAGRPNWLNAEHHWQRLVGNGANPSDLLASVERYAHYVRAGGVSSSRYVIAPVKFFGDADQPWQQPWELPKPINPDSAKREERDAAAWAEARARAAAIGFREPDPMETPESYMTQVKRAEERRPPSNNGVAQLAARMRAK